MIILLMMTTKMNRKIILAILFCLLAISCANRKDGWMTPDTLIFLNVTNGEDTCLAWTFPSSLYYQLNIKCMSERNFYRFIEKTIEKNQAIVVSNSYFLIREDYKTLRNATADSIHKECGLEGLKRYVENNPPILVEGDKEAFLWAAYILWENNILVAEADEDAAWYTIEKR